MTHRLYPVKSLQENDRRRKKSLPETCAKLRGEKKHKFDVGFVHLHVLLPQICKLGGVYLSFKFILQSQPIFHLLYISKILRHITQALNSQTSHT